MYHYFESRAKTMDKNEFMTLKKGDLIKFMGIVCTVASAPSFENGFLKIDITSSEENQGNEKPVGLICLNEEHDVCELATMEKIDCPQSKNKNPSA
jgi:hypothetical protein